VLLVKVPRRQEALTTLLTPIQALRPKRKKAGLAAACGSATAKPAKSASSAKAKRADKNSVLLVASVTRYLREELGCPRLTEATVENIMCESSRTKTVNDFLLCRPENLLDTEGWFLGHLHAHGDTARWQAGL
jgi:hypothetical protein